MFEVFKACDRGFGIAVGLGHQQCALHDGLQMARQKFRRLVRDAGILEGLGTDRLELVDMR